MSTATLAARPCLAAPSLVHNGPCGCFRGEGDPPYFPTTPGAQR